MTLPSAPTRPRPFRRLAGLIFCGAFLLIPAGAHADPPTITETTFSAVTTTSALLEATVNPGGKSTPYHFEYGTTDCETGPCTAVPSPDAPAGNGTALLKLSFPLTGLSPDTTYHFRLLAKNSESPLDPETNEREYVKGPEATFTTHALPPTFEPCPNEAFRQGLPSATLPDCRAYEQATPIAKNAGEATSVPWLQAAADDGDAVTFLSDAGFPDAEGAQDMPLYLATRNASGWSSQGVLPSGTLAHHDARILGWLPDLSEVFSRVANQGTPPISAFVSRPGVGPGTRMISPFSPRTSYSYADSSADERLVLFEEVSNATRKSTLWLWDRTTDTRKEVSVLNDDDGSPAPLSAFAGPFDWAAGTTTRSLSEGGSNRLYYTHDSNVLSDDGLALFFTASETGQLYLRRNPTEAQGPVDAQGTCTNSALACTIQVSKSRKTDGKGPNGTDSAGSRPAVFHTASANGRYVFFTSSEKLTNDANTGPEPQAPTIGSADLSSDPPALALDFLPARASGLAVDDEFIYWADPVAATIGRAELDGEDLRPGFISTGPGSPQYVAVDDSHIYWSNRAVGEEPEEEPPTSSIPTRSEGTIGRADIDGDPASVETDFITGASDPQGIALGDGYIYWANAAMLREPGGTAISRADLSGENIQRHYLDTPFNGRPRGVAVDAYHIYWTEHLRQTTGDGAMVHRADLSDGSNVVSLYEGREFPPPDDTPQFGDLQGLTVTPSHLYWVRRATKTIARADLDLTDVEREFISAEGSLKGIAVDDQHLFFSANGDSLPNPGNDLYGYDSTTDQLTDLTVDPDSEDGAEVTGILGTSDDGSRVYFAANGVLDEEPNFRDEVAEPGNCGAATENASCNLYLSVGDDSPRFIARLEESWRNWAASPGGEIVPNPKTSRLSADGRFLLFTSSRQLTAFDNIGHPVLYRYDAVGDMVLCVSCNPSGERPGHSVDFVGAIPRLTSKLRPGTELPGPSGSFLSRAFSENGNRVFFETTDALVGADVDGLDECPSVGSTAQQEFGLFRTCQDVYQWQAPNTGGCEKANGCLSLLTLGDDDSPSFFAGASSSGDDVFIFTRAQLVGSDTDQLRDVYDLRVGGGLPSQYPVPQVICDAAESCKLGPAAPPETPSPGSAGFQGAGDPPVKRTRCRKGKVRKKGKCVKKAKRKRKHKKATRR